MTDRSAQDLIREWEDLLPPWAIKKAVPGIYEVGSNLPTRDGRRMGNAHIIAIKASRLDTGRPYYEVLTDAGSVCIMNSTELNDQFWPPRWVSKLDEILAKFDRRELEPQ